MTLTAAVLILISAFGHAFWNLLGKRQAPSGAYFWAAGMFVTLVTLPVLWAWRDLVLAFPPGVWILLVITGCFQALYFFGLGSAYRHGDMSLAYPLARALPVLLVAGISITFRLGKEIHPWALVGMGLVALGCVILPLYNFREFKLSRYLNLCCLLAAVAALGTTGYTLIDDTALRQLRALPDLQGAAWRLPLVFIVLENWFTSIPLGLIVFFNKGERTTLRDLVANRGMWGTAALTGIVMTITYTLVLAAMGYVTNVSYVSAFRQLSIPLGAALGMVVQKEPHPLPRLVGIGVILLGLVLVALG